MSDVDLAHIASPDVISTEVSRKYRSCSPARAHLTPFHRPARRR